MRIGLYVFLAFVVAAQLLTETCPAQAKPSADLALVVYARNATAKSMADDVPTAAERKAPFVVRLAGNEYEPLQIGLYVPPKAAGLRNLRIATDCPIPHTTGHVYYQRKQQRSILPLYVIPTPRIAAIEPGRTASFWLTFSTDATTRPGRYEGVFTIYADDTVLRKQTFVVEVRPFVLPRPKITYGLYYQPYQAPPPFRGRAYQEQYLPDMAAHGMNTMMVYVHANALSDPAYDRTSSSPYNEGWSSETARFSIASYFGPEDYQPDGGFNAIKYLEAQVAAGRKAGLVTYDHPILVTGAWAAPRKDLVLATLRKLADKDQWPPFFMYMYDEPPPGNPEITVHLEEWRRLRAPNVTAMQKPAPFGLGYLHDLWIVKAGFTHMSEELLHEAARVGATVWTYHYILRTTNFEANRYFSGLYTWSLGLSGNHSYAYMGEPGTSAETQRQPSFDAEWKLSAPSIYGFVIPSPVGPVPGVGFEGRREGVDDYRYLQLLESRISGDPTNDVAELGRRWLDELRKRSFAPDFNPAQADLRTSDKMDPHPGLAPGDYDEIRKIATSFIERLPPAPGERNEQPSTPVRWRPGMEAESLAYEDKDLETCIAALRSGTVKQQRQAAAALALRTPKDVLPALPVLVDALDEPDVRMVALRVIARFGTDAASVVPRLRELSKHPDRFIQTAVAYVASTIGEAAGDLRGEVRLPAINQKSGFCLTPPSEAHYLDGTDYDARVGQLRVVATLPAAGWLFKNDPEQIGVEQGFF